MKLTAAQEPRAHKVRCTPGTQCAVSLVCSFALPAAQTRWGTCTRGKATALKMSQQTQCPGHGWRHTATWLPLDFQDTDTCFSRYEASFSLLPAGECSITSDADLGSSYPGGISVSKGFDLSISSGPGNTSPLSVCVNFNSSLLKPVSRYEHPSTMRAQARVPGPRREPHHPYHTVPEGSGTEVQHKAGLHEQTRQEGDKGLRVLGFLCRGKLSHPQNVPPGKMTKEKEE